MKEVRLMKLTGFSLVIIIITMFFGCSHFGTHDQFVVDQHSFKNVDAFETFAKSFPDSAWHLLEQDLLIDKQATEANVEIDPQTVNTKILLFTELSLRQFQAIENDSLLQRAVSYFDSVFAADYVNAKHGTKRLFETQWARAKAHYFSGYYWQNCYEFQTATDEYITALKILDSYFSDDLSEKKYLLQGSIHYQFGQMFFRFDMFGSSKDTYKKAFQCFQKTADSVAIAMSCYGLSDACNRLGDFATLNDTAFYYARMGLCYVDSLRHPAETAMLLGKIGDAYRYELNLDSALPFFNRAIAMMPETDNRRFDIYTHIGFVYFLRNDFEAALPWLLKGAESEKFFEQRSAFWGLSDIYSCLGEKEKAAEMGRIVRDYQVQADHIKRQSSIVISQCDDYESTIAKQTIFQQTRSIVILFIIIVVVFMTLLFFLLRYVFEKKNKKILNAEKQQATQSLNSTIRQQQQTQFFQQQWNAFEQTEIYHTVSTRCVGIPLTKNSLQMTMAPLKPNELALLEKTVNQLFNQAMQQLQHDYPTLAKGEIEYCCLSLLDLRETEKAALSGISYDGISTRRRRTLAKLNTDFKHLTPFLKTYLKTRGCC